MKKIIIIGAGGVGHVVAHKCAQLAEVFPEILLASRTESKCVDIAKHVLQQYGRTIKTAQVDADDVSDLVRLFDNYKPFMVINVALPYQDLTIMDACLEMGVHYLDTANYEPLDTAKFEYKWLYLGLVLILAPPICLLLLLPSTILMKYMNSILLMSTVVIMATRLPPILILR